MSKILIIEDEEAIADLEKDYLELSGFEVEIEHRGDVGLKRSLTEDFNLVILDLMLPEMNGFDICREIRAQKNTPIIMVSAKKDDIDKIRGLGLGADDYMTKPFSPSELVARVKAHLARYERLIGSGVQENDIIEIRGIKIDKTARTECLQRMSYSGKSGIWSLWEILLRLRCILRRSGRRSSLIQRSRSILKRSGELDIGLKFDKNRDSFLYLRY